MMEKSDRQPKILVTRHLQAGDDPLWDILSHQQKWQILLESDMSKLLARWEHEIPDVIVIDHEHNGISVLGLIRDLRLETVTPILLFTEITREDFLLNAYNAGADDCILLPVSLSMVVARIDVWLRRSWNVPAEALTTLKIGSVQLFPQERLVRIGNGSPLQLTNLELRLLYSLMSRAGQAINSEDLIINIWGGYNGGGDHTMLKNVIYRLRKKIEDESAQTQIIQTVPGLGYKLAID